MTANARTRFPREIVNGGKTKTCLWGHKRFHSGYSLSLKVSIPYIHGLFSALEYTNFHVFGLLVFRKYHGREV